MNKPIKYYHDGVIYNKILSEYKYSCSGCDLNINDCCFLQAKDENVACGSSYIYKKDIISTRKEKIIKIFKKF